MGLIKEQMISPKDRTWKPDPVRMKRKFKAMLDASQMSFNIKSAQQK